MNALEQRMAARILLFEDERATGPESLKVRRLPSADRGGRWEVCGICDGIEPAAFRRIKALLDEGRRKEAWEACLEYVWTDTRSVRSWIGSAAYPATEFFLRDHCFNSGGTNTVKILQRALNDEGASPALAVDGIVGDATRSALRRRLLHGRERDFLTCLRDRRKAFYLACKQFPEFGRGWLRRTDEARDFALTLC